ncbi:MAG: ATP synthase F1 subunit gamma [Ignavibacteriae bacterium]|nr:ATP synthase F1 subunit gamma [Ignavibacteriota bacterium]
MATLREIRRRIGGVKSTQKITKAMKMVAAAKLRRAQDAIIAARPYARKMKELLQHLAIRVEVASNPFFIVRPVHKVAIIVVTADRGLCGAFNANIIKAAVTHIKTVHREFHAAGKVELICVGKKGFDFFLKNNYEIMSKHIGVFSGLTFVSAQSIVTEVVQGFLKGEYDQVEVVYNEFKSIIQQRVVIEQLLPIPPLEIPPHIASRQRRDTSHIPYIYEPSSESLIKALVPKHLNFQMWRVLLESNAAEQGARMAAMDNATTNASDLIRSLQLSYNKARQASITKELLEIVSGAEALKKAG